MVCILIADIGDDGDGEQRFQRTRYSCVNWSTHWYGAKKNWEWERNEKWCSCLCPGFMDLETEAVSQMLQEKGLIGLSLWWMTHSRLNPQTACCQAAVWQLTSFDVPCSKPTDLCHLNLSSDSSLPHPLMWFIQRLSQKHTEEEDRLIGKSYLIPNIRVDPSGFGLHWPQVKGLSFLLLS